MVALEEPIAGRRLLQTLEQQVQQARQLSSTTRAQLEALDQAVRELVARKGEALTSLAEHYLPEMTHEHIRKTFHAIRDDLEQILARKELREKQLQEEWNTLLDDRRRLERELETVTDELNRLVARREELEAQVAEKLQQDSEFQRLSEQIVATDQELHRNERRVDEIKQEAGTKLPAYNRSRLFQYLYARRFGTPEYAGRGLVRRWDRWVAELIGYARARRSYDFLRTTPERMAAEVQRRRDSLAELMQQAETIEDKLAGESGLTDVLRQGDAAGARRTDLIAQLDQRSQHGEGIEQERIELEGTQNEYYDQAIGRFKQFLASMEESALEACTRSTPDPHDDRMFAEIKHVNQRLEATKDDSAAVHEEFRDWDARIGGLEQVVRRFRAAEFDSDRSLFRRGFDLPEALQQYLSGNLGQQELWASIKQHQQFAPLWYEEGMRHPGDLLGSDFSQVLLRALAEAARHAAQNSSYGGSISRGSGFPRRASRSSIPRSIPRSIPHSRPGGFTSGRGF